MEKGTNISRQNNCFQMMGNLSTKPENKLKRSREQTEIIYGDQKKLKTEVNPLQLWNLNDDCLEHIFQFLDIQDLVNIAETDDRFISPTVSVYSRYYRTKKKVFVNLSSIQCDHANVDCVEIQKCNNIEAFFKHFGYITSNLLVNFFGSSYDKIENIIQKYCGTSLIHLNLTFCCETDFERINQPFTKVQTFTVIESKLGKEISQLNVWFPCLTKLELVYTSFTQPNHLELNFKYLKHLEIYNTELDLTESTMRELFRLNPQLISLVLLCDYDVDFLRFVNQCLPNLEELELWSPQNRFSTFNGSKIHFKQVTKFTLNALSYRGDFVVNMPFKFTNLNELKFDGFNQFKDHLLTFIKDCNGIDKLTLIPYIEDWDDLTYNDLVDFVNIMPNLTVLEFCADTIAEKDIIELLSTSKNLQEVHLLFIELPINSRFRNVIEKDWSVNSIEICSIDSHMNYYSFILNRKN